MPVIQRTLTKEVPYQTEQQIKDLTAGHNGLEASFGTLVAKIQAQPAQLTLAQIKAGLSSTGAAPLNIIDLVGGTPTGSDVLVDIFANRPAANKVTSGTVFAASDRGYQAWYSTGGTVWTLLAGWGGPMLGTVLSVDQRPVGLAQSDIGFVFQGTDANNAWWRWSGTAWVFQIGTGVPIEVTLNPSTLPVLTVHDAGFGVWATDYHRFYLWSGAGWQEGEHNDARYQIGWFTAVPDQNGWFKCDGSLVQQSTQVASITPFTTPNLNGRVLRSNTAASGGTGGSDTHTHQVVVPDENSGQPNATTQVDNTLAGSTVQVGSATHVHDVPSQTFLSGSASSLPAYYEAIPYIRL